MPFFRLLMVAAAFSSGEAFTPGVHAPAVRRVAAVSTVMTAQDSDNDGSLISQGEMMTMLNLPPFPVGPAPGNLTDDGPGGGGSIDNGIEISSGGLGSVQGAMFTAPGYGKTTVKLTFHATAISQDDMKKVDNFMKSALNASKYESYKTHAEAAASGSWSLFGDASASANAKATADAMSGYGLTEEQQKEVLRMVTGFLPQESTFSYKTEITNPSPFPESGQMYIYQFTGTITVDQHSTSKQMIAGPVARTTGGESLPITNSFV